MCVCVCVCVPVDHMCIRPRLAFRRLQYDKVGRVWYISSREHDIQMAKSSESVRYVLRVIQPSTHSTLSEYDSRPQLATCRYVWYVTWYPFTLLAVLRPTYGHVHLGLSTLHRVTHVRKCTTYNGSLVYPVRQIFSRNWSRPID